MLNRGAVFAKCSYTHGSLGLSVKAPPRPPRTKWTRRVPHPILIGHAASLTPYRPRAWSGSRATSGSSGSLPTRRCQGRVHPTASRARVAMAPRAAAAASRAAAAARRRRRPAPLRGAADGRRRRCRWRMSLCSRARRRRTTSSTQNAPCMWLRPPPTAPPRAGRPAVALESPQHAAFQNASSAAHS